MSHTKPTQEELDNGIKAAEAAAEDLKKNPEEKEEGEDEGEGEKEQEGEEKNDENNEDQNDEESGDEKNDDDAGDEEAGEESDKSDNEDDKGEEDSDKKDKLPPVEERLKESGREAQVLYAKNKKTQESIQKAFEIPEPTIDDLKLEFAEWDDMTSVEQRLAKDNLWNNLKLAKINEAAQEGKDIDVWNGKVDEFIDDPKTLIATPDLEGKTEAFKVFAGKPTRRGVPFDDLVAAFLYDASKNAKPKQKGQMFETGHGGDKKKPGRDDGKLTTEEGERLRTANFKEYKKKLIAGQIADPV